MGEITKKYVDCGGTVREEKIANFQLWTADDYDHRLKPQKVIDIIEMAEKEIGLENLEIEVEYQSETIGKYGLEFEEDRFLSYSYRNRLFGQRKMRYPRSSISKYGSNRKFFLLFPRERVLLSKIYLGTGPGTRTPNQLIKSQLLYQLS